MQLIIKTFTSKSLSRKICSTIAKDLFLPPIAIFSMHLDFYSYNNSENLYTFK